MKTSIVSNDLKIYVICNVRLPKNAACNKINLTLHP